MPRCACAIEVYGSVFCVCRLLQLLKDQQVRLLVMFSWILIRGFAASFSSYGLLGMPLFRIVRSETCPCSVATLLSSQLSALER